MIQIVKYIPTKIWWEKWYSYYFFLKFQAPEKKPLVRRDPVEDVHAKVRKGSQNMLPDPIEDLQEFHDRHFQDLETI